MPQHLNQKIPLTLKDFVIDNDATLPTRLIDGDLESNYVPTYEPIHKPLEVWVDLLPYNATVRSVKMFDKYGSNFNTKVILVRKDTGAEVQIGTFTGGGFPGVNRSYPSEGSGISTSFVASRLVLRSDVGGEGWGSELEIFADYDTPAPFTFTKTFYPLGYMQGVNLHPYNIADNGQPELLQSTNYGGGGAGNAYQALLDLYASSIRCYTDMPNINQGAAGVYTWNPSKGGWYMDALFNRLKTDLPGSLSWSCLQLQSEHIAETWRTPDTSQQWTGTVTQYIDYGTFGTLKVQVDSNVVGSGSFKKWWLELTSAPASGKTTAQYKFISDKDLVLPLTVGTVIDMPVPDFVHFVAGDKVKVSLAHQSSLNFPYTKNSPADRLTPDAYRYMGEVAFNYATRYASLGDAIAGESMNEQDQKWNKYDNYLNGAQWAYAQSVIYDGHKGLFPNCGYKAASPTFQVIASGAAYSTLDALRAAMEVWKATRGYLPSGAVDVPFDIYQWHHYSFTGGSAQYAGGVNAGLPPELSDMFHDVEATVEYLAKWCPHVKFIVGEHGIDVNPNSNMNAAPVAPYNVEQVRGMWCIRTLLGFAARGVWRSQWFRLFQVDESNGDSTQFASMSLLTFGSTITRKLVGHNWKQLSEFKGYTFDAQLSGAPYVLRFKNGTSRMVAIWAVEQMTTQTNQKPTFANVAGTYSLALPTGTAYTKRTLQDTGDFMGSTSGTVAGGALAVGYDAKPVFIIYNEDGSNPNPGGGNPEPVITRIIRYILRVRRRRG